MRRIYMKKLLCPKCFNRERSPVLLTYEFHNIWHTKIICERCLFSSDIIQTLTQRLGINYVLKNWEDKCNEKIYGNK